MTIEVTHYHGVHQGGTKDYHLYLIAGPKTAIIVKRYGKTGSAGQMLTEEKATGATATRAFNKLLDERGKKGYDMRKQSDGGNFQAMEDALRILPPVHQRSIHQSTIAKVNGIDPTGQTGTFDPLAEERAKLTEQMRQTAMQTERDAEMAALKANPNFGMF